VLQKTIGAIKNEQSRDTGNIEYTRHDEDKEYKNRKGKKDD
jgi:hypothetical protein